MSYYCRICGSYLPNEKFSGSGHRNHICKSCHRLPPEKREELKTINRIMNLNRNLSKANQKWLEQMLQNENDAIREAAELAWLERFAPFRSTEDWPEELLKAFFGPVQAPLDSDSPEDDFDLPF